MVLSEFTYFSVTMLVGFAAIIPLMASLVIIHNKSYADSNQNLGISAIDYS